MNRFLPLATCAVALVANLGFTADPSLSPISSPQSPIPLVIISPHGEDVKTEFARAFSSWHEKKYGQQVKIDWRDLGGTNDDLKFIISEFTNKPDGIGIDLFFGGGDYPFYDLAGRGMLASYHPPPKVLDYLPRDIGSIKMYDADHFTWFGAATAGFGIAYNKKVLRAKGWPEPKSWEDLTNPRYAGWISSGDPRHSGSTYMMYELILQAYGWERGWAIIYQMGANAREFHKSSATAVKQCTSGDTAYALAIDFYAFMQVGYVGKENFGWIMPPEIAVMNPDGIAMLKGAPHRELAERFLNFVLGEEGQKLWFLPRGHPEGPQRFNISRMSLRRDFYERFKDITPVTVNPFLLKTVPFDAKKSAARQKLVAALIGATVIDTHEEAVKALASIKETKEKWSRYEPAKSTWPSPEENIAGFSKPPLFETDALAMAKEKWSDPKFRSRQIIEWQRWARDKYRKFYER